MTVPCSVVIDQRQTRTFCFAEHPTAACRGGFSSLPALASLGQSCLEELALWNQGWCWDSEFQMGQPITGTWQWCTGPICLIPWMTNEMLFQGPGVTHHTHTHTHKICSPSSSACGVGWGGGDCFSLVFRIIWRCFSVARPDEVLMTLYTRHPQWTTVHRSLWSCTSL